MAITLLCPDLKCRALLQVPDTVRGKKVRCGKCGMTLIVPNREPGTGDPSRHASTTKQSHSR